MHTGPNVSLELLLASIAASPIIITASEPRDFADWCRRQPADIDAVILDWLRSQVRQRSALS
jgi:hypothetical protein